MKSKLFSLLCLSVLVLVMFGGVVSADLTLKQIGPPESVEHGSDVTITFNLTATNNVYDTLVWNGIGSNMIWKTFPSVTSIDANAELTLTAVLTIDEHASGTITDAQISVQNGTTSPIGLPLSQIIINPSPSLTVSDVTIKADENTTTITIENTGNVDLNNIELTHSIEDFGITLPESISITAGGSQEVEVSIIRDDVNFGINEFTITATQMDGEEDVMATAEGKINVETSFCEDCENPGHLKIDIEDITVIEGFGDDDEYWYPFDEIEIDLIVESDTYDIEDIEVEWALYTESGYKLADDKEKDFDLDDGDDRELTISFKLDNRLSKLEGEGKLIFYVKATGEIDDDAYGDDKDKTCDEDSQSVELITNDDFMILDDFQFNGFKLGESMELLESISCGTELQITADVWNIGDGDQDDVYVIIYNQELGINQQIEIGDINAFDSEKLEALLNIPANAEEKWYTLRFTIYDEDNDIFENKKDDLAEFEIFIKIEGNCIESIVSVYANLESGGKAGQELTVKAIITNLGNELVAYSLEVSGEDEWASSVELSPSTITLGAGESKEVLITFDVNKDALGEQLFNIEVLEGEELILAQPVSVSIEKAGFSFPGITGNVISKDNWYLWGIGALNVILVLIIISIALKVMKK